MSEKSTPAPLLLVVQPDELACLFNFEAHLNDAGLVRKEVRPWAGDEVPDVLEADGLLVMGGSMSSLDDAAYPWLETIRALMRDAAERERPTLGVCLGAQLMAQAFGGRTGRGESGLEAGLVEVAWRPEACDDPLVAGLPAPFISGAMHGDAAVSLPPDAVWLGSGTVYPHQAFRVGSCSWGIQFHPEIDHRHFRVWADAHHDPTPEESAQLAAGEQALRARAPELAAGAQAIAHRFASLVTSSMLA